MAHLYWGVESSQVRDDTHAKYLDATMPCHDDLRNGGHADGISAYGAKHTVFCRRLKGRSLNANIYTVLEFEILFLGQLISQGDEFAVVGLVHVGETGTCWEVRAMQWMLGEEIDMVCNDHQVTDAELRVHSSGCVADEKCFDAQFVHHALWKGNLFHGIAFVIMEASFHGHDVFASQLAENQSSGMSLNG